MKLGFTGTQQGMSKTQRTMLLAYLRSNKISEFHHGDCIGADAQADVYARIDAHPIHIHPPIVKTKRAFCYVEGDVEYPAKEYLARNRDIVDMTDVLIAAPKGDEEELRSGTWATVRYARKRGKTVIVLPRGELALPT